MLGATGTAGRATAQALVAQGHDVVCLVRPGGPRVEIAGATMRSGDALDPASVRQDGLRGEGFDTVVSCLASRSGNPRDAWAIDHRAHLDLLSAAQEAGATQFVLLSAICVQKPLLEFQRAKLAFEDVLIGSGLTYSIVRPTAFFKSLSGQIDRVRKGKSFLLFGDGTLTACKPISDGDLGAFIAGCVDDETRHNRILPIGGPGPAITPKDQADTLFALLGQEPKYKHVPVALMDGIIAVLRGLGRFSPKLADKADLARIGRYYATESMLVWDAAAQRYDAEATPETGTETLFAFYAQVIAGKASVDLGEHSVF